MPALIAYIVLIAAINYGFRHVPLVPVLGEMWPPLSLAVGLVFVARDFAQRAVGHWVWAGMIAGCLLSWWMADPYIALASATAFLVSEAADWGVYTWTRRPLHDRILISSAASAPVDSVVFLSMIGHLSAVGVVLMVASKMAAALLLYATMRAKAEGRDQ